MLITAAAGPQNVRHFFVGGMVVTLDGREITDVAEADDEAGFVVRYLRDGRGNPIRGRQDGMLVTERLTGVVAFVGQRRTADDPVSLALAKRARRAARNRTIANRAEIRQVTE